jgi:hypothetical protein
MVLETSSSVLTRVCLHITLTSIKDRFSDQSWKSTTLIQIMMQVVPNLGNQPGITVR